MSRRLSFAMATTLLALVLGVAGAVAAPTGLAAKPPDTTVAGIDVDATTIPELQKLMNAHRLNSVQLTQFYLHRISKLNPILNAVITVSPTALADARAADRIRGGLINRVVRLFQFHCVQLRHISEGRVVRAGRCKARFRG